MDTNDQQNIKGTPSRPQVKICGLTRVDEALECAELGADAIGFVFFPKSPRNVTDDQAKEIITALPVDVKKVGVFVNESFSYIMHKVEHCRLNAVQLHGQELPELVKRLSGEDLIVIKALFSGGKPSFEEAPQYDASAYLVECAKGMLPGGNAMTWNWKEAGNVNDRCPLVLAGGLSPENIREAIASCMPDAVDISSCVEKSPGRKDPGKVKSFVDAVSQAGKPLKADRKKLRRIF